MKSYFTSSFRLDYGTLGTFQTDLQFVENSQRKKW